MARTVGLGKQDFEKVISRNNFYIDKTMFIKEWWENDDEVTLITRPRRFGKPNNFFLWNMPTRVIYSRTYPYGKRKDTAGFRELAR